MVLMNQKSVAHDNFHIQCVHDRDQELKRHKYESLDFAAENKLWFNHVESAKCELFVDGTAELPNPMPPFHVREQLAGLQLQPT